MAEYLVDIPHMFLDSLEGLNASNFVLLRRANIHVGLQVQIKSPVFINSITCSGQGDSSELGL